MPNWCYNKVSFIGENSRLEEIEDFLRTEKFGFDLNAITPYPEVYRQMDEEKKESLNAAYVAKWNTDKDGFNSGGYDWRMNNWGVKWNISKDQVTWEEPNDGELTADFDTAWSPPIESYLTLSKKFPDVKIEAYYHESGMCFEGEFEVLNGEVLVDNCRNFQDERDEYQDWYERELEEEKSLTE